MNRQEALWSGSFGDEYHKRNDELASRCGIWERILFADQCRGLVSVLEFGCGSGANLRAIKEIWPELSVAGVDINASVEPNYVASILNPPDISADLVITCGLLIHIHPDDLWTAYDNLVGATNKYLCIMEYYNPEPVEVPYRDTEETLWKRDFAGELLDRYPLKLIDYGFAYHRDGILDDTTWFLMEKTDG